MWEVMPRQETGTVHHMPVKPQMYSVLIIEFYKYCSAYFFNLRQSFQKFSLALRDHAKVG